MIANTIADIYLDQIQKSLSYSSQNRLTNIQNQMDELTNEMIKIQQDINNNSINMIPVNLELDTVNNELNSKNLDIRNLQTSFDQSLNLEEVQTGSNI